MNQTTCDILLYAGKWSPRICRSLRLSFTRVIQDASSVEIAANDGNDGNDGNGGTGGPRITAIVTYPSADSESVREGLEQDLLYYMRPQYGSQVEVEIVEERADSDTDDDLYD